MISKVVIIPTGNEILNGIVTDTNSPAIMQVVLETYPACEIARLKPCVDVEMEIMEEIDHCVKEEFDLFILIGGSGGGHRYDSSLGKDYTHTALAKYTTELKSREIYGKNGHLWSKLIAGRKESSLLINVPGPYTEAVEATKACLKCLYEGKLGLDELVDATAHAVYKMYPSGGVIKS